MVLIKKVDVDQHFAARRAMRRNAFRSVSQPLPSVRSETEPAATGADAPGFAEDFTLEHSSSRVSVTPHAIGAGSVESHVPAAPGSRTA
jgi:hypothetical protein